ncbi:hypothetical protein SDC9_119254 [bioreactor metagenome]|uniref:Uncharacterized protein n=1 Tax=bioreactor metagenome TaxID=1076179 RepID=A0A645C5M3_9ZZZZ
MRFLLLELGIGIAHLHDQIVHHLVEERRLLAQLVAMTNRAADDAALHVATTFVGRDHAIGHQERGGADVVGNHLQRRRVQIGGVGLTACGLDERLEQVDLVVAVHMLQDGGQALQAHAGVHAGCGQTHDGAVFLHVELHEHVVPDLDEAVAVFVRAAWRAASDVRAVVIEDFRAGAARAGVSHHPEIVALVAAALVVADADHTLGRQTDHFGPDVIGLIVFFIDGGQQLFCGQAKHLGQQLPTPLNRFELEVVAKRPVAQHLEEGVVTRGIAHVLKIVVLAARAQAGLHRCGAVVRALVFPEEHVLELHHARVGEHQRGVVARHQRAGRHHGVPLGSKKVQERLANICD